MAFIKQHFIVRDSRTPEMEYRMRKCLMREPEPLGDPSTEKIIRDIQQRFDPDRWFKNEIKRRKNELY